MKIYEIWRDVDYPYEKNRFQRIEIYLDVEDAKKRVDELNDKFASSGCEHYIFVLDLSKTKVTDFTTNFPIRNGWRSEFD